ncbi:hypothetical protein PYW08_009487 [Mythimna loreyi]|uniref:Uncharacterized protein n=1 Tax=Mythimna loreyi TaxID=667449 RepID=A0ACC2Q7W2_9NEOP|nr:hypothetical protein PYW08_009487 [Mythimna loreyi]
MYAVVLVCITCAAWWWWRRQSAKSSEPPCWPGGWPVVGHAPRFIGDAANAWNQLKIIADQSNEFGGVVAVSIGPRTIYCITDPDDCYTITNTCLEKDSYYDFAEPWLGDGLITARYAVWKDHHKHVHPAFNQTFLDTFIGVFNSQSRKLVKSFENNAGKGPFDHYTKTQQIALETICLTALGVDFSDSSFITNYIDALDPMFSTTVERFTKPWWHSSYLFSFSKLKKTQDFYMKILQSMASLVLKKRKSEVFGNTDAERSITPETKFKPFIDNLLEQSVEKGVFTDKQIREHIDTILVVGHQTTAHVLTYTMVLLGSHPDVQEKLFSEIQEVLGEDRDVEKMDLSKLTYLEAVLKESLRVITVTPLIARKLERDIKLKNYTVSAGRTCVLMFHGLHKHPMWGPDRHEFKPERWLEPGKMPDHPNAFAPFGLGRRRCIGKTYAMMSLKVTLAHVVRNYRIMADHTKMRFKYGIVLKPDNEGHYVNIEKRSSL